MEKAYLCLSLLSTQNLRSCEGDTFAVAWVDPDFKHFTVVNSSGDTQPDWNPELILYLEEHQLQQSDKESVTVEIYTKSCLKHELLGNLRVPFADFMTESGGLSERSYAIIDVSGNTQGTVLLSARLDASSVVELPPSTMPENISVPGDLGEMVQLQFADRSVQSAEEGRTDSWVQSLSQESSLNPGTDRASYSTSDQDSSMAICGLESSNDSPSIRSKGKTDNLGKRAASASQLIESASSKSQGPGNGGLSTEIQAYSTTTHTRTDSFSSEAESPDIRQEDSSPKGSNQRLLQQARKARTTGSASTHFRVRPSPQPAKQKNSARSNSFPQREAGSKQLQKHNLSLPTSFELRHSQVSSSQEESTASSASVNVSSLPPPRRKVPLRNKQSKDGHGLRKEAGSAGGGRLEDFEPQKFQHRRGAPGLKGNSFHGVGGSTPAFKFQQPQRNRQPATIARRGRPRSSMQSSIPESGLDKTLHVAEEADASQDMPGLKRSFFEAEFPQQLPCQASGSPWASGDQTNQPSSEEMGQSSELRIGKHAREFSLPEINEAHRLFQHGQSKLEGADSRLEASITPQEQKQQQGHEKQLGTFSSQPGGGILIGRSKSFHDDSAESLVASRVQQFENMIQSELQGSQPRKNLKKERSSELILANPDKENSMITCNPGDRRPVPIAANASAPELISPPVLANRDQPTSETHGQICCPLDSDKSVHGEYATQVPIQQESGNSRNDAAAAGPAPANKAGQADQYHKSSDGQPPQESTDLSVSQFSMSTPTDRDEIVISPDPDESFAVRAVDSRQSIVTARQEATNQNQGIVVRPQSNASLNQSLNQSGTRQPPETRKPSKGWWSCSCKLGRFCCACYTAEF